MERVKRTTELLKGYYDHFYKSDGSGFNPLHPTDYERNLYKGDLDVVLESINALKEQLPEQFQENFQLYAENVHAYLESPMNSNGIVLWETFALPILADIYPRITSPLVFTEIPMSSKEMTRTWKKAFFTPSGATEAIEGPVLDQDISSGRKVGYSEDAVLKVANNGTDENNILHLGGETKDTSKIERGNFVIYAVAELDELGAGEFVNVAPIIPASDMYNTTEPIGPFSATVKIGEEVDIISGQVNYDTGEVVVNSSYGKFNAVKVRAKLSLELNTISPKVEIKEEKFNIIAELRQIEASWTVAYEQDQQAMYKLESASDFVSASTEQLALDTDIDAYGKVADAVELSPAEHRLTFDYNSPQPYYNTSNHHQDIMVEVNKGFSHILQNSKLWQGKKVIVANDNVANIFSSLNGYNVTRTSEGGAVGYKEITVSGEELTIIVTPVIPRNKAFLVIKGLDEKAVTAIHANFIPAMTVSYPNTNLPTCTTMRRFKNQIIRDTAFGDLQVANIL